MCAQRVASILAEIGIDSSKFTSGAKGIMSGLGDMIGGLGKMGPLLGIGAAALGILVDQMGKAEKAAVESAKADAVVNAVLASTGQIAGMTEGKLNDLANQISVNAGLDDELVKSGEAVLLTFTRIGSDVFPQTMQAASDMAAVLGGDLNGKITMIGKAMNDFSGYTALKRAGVSFTEEQIKQIAHFKETNDLVGYQGLLLKELQTEYGGAAAKINAVSDGSENAKVAIGNLQEAIGKKMIPAQRWWNALLTDTANGLTQKIDETDKYTASMEQLGITYAPVVNGHRELYKYMRDGVVITEEEKDAMIAASNAAYVATDRYDKMAPSVLRLGENAGLTDEEIQKLNDDMLRGAEAVTGWQESYTNAKEGSDQFDLSLKLIRTGLQEFGAAGEEVFQSVLLGIGDISPAAVTAYIEMQTVVGNIKKMMEAGFSTDVIVNYVINVKNGGGTGIPSQGGAAGEFYQLGGNAPTAKSSGNVGKSYTDANGISWQQNLNSDGSEKGWSKVGIGGANGLDMVVPAGYPNDSFPIRAQSGEHVQITPAGQGVDNTELLAEIRSLNNKMSSFARETGDAMGIKLMQLGLA